MLAAPAVAAMVVAVTKDTTASAPAVLSVAAALFSVLLLGPECQAAQEGAGNQFCHRGQEGEREESVLASLSRQSPAGMLAPQVHANEGERINILAIPLP